MGGSRRTTTNVSQQQQQSQSLGSTPAAMGFLPQYQAATQTALDTGPYTGDVVAAPTQVDAYAPTVPNVSGFVADPGAPLEDYTPDVQIQDRYVAGAPQSSRDFVSMMTPTIQGTAQDLGDFWAQVAGGDFLDAGNPALAGYLDSLQQEAGEDYEGAIGQLQSEAIDSGAYGGTAYGTAATGIADRFQENVGNQRASILYQNFLNEMARRERAGAGSAGALSLGLAPGEVERGFNQLDIDDTLARAGEVERGQALDIADEQARREDTALRTQAGLENELGLANWNIYQQQAGIQDDVMRANVDQMIRQAGLTNEAARNEAIRYGDMDVLDRYFSGLSNPVFGSESEGTMTGTSTTKTKTPLWQDILGAASAAAEIWGSLRNPAAPSAKAAEGGGGGGAQGPAPQAAPMFTPMQFPSIPYAQRFFRPFGPYQGSPPPYGGP